MPEPTLAPETVQLRLQRLERQLRFLRRGLVALALGAGTALLLGNFDEEEVRARRIEALEVRLRGSDGKTHIRLSGTGPEITVLDAKGNEALRIGKNDQPGMLVLYDPSSKRKVVLTGTGLELYDAEGKSSTVP
jgi:hypothetical protein